jgi:hypothetical protein
LRGRLSRSSASTICSPVRRTTRATIRAPAFRRGIQGAAIICCVAREDRTLDCASVLEWPADEGFGEASLAVAREFRLSEESYAAYSETPGNWLRRIIIWRLSDRYSPQFERGMELVREINQRACAPEGAASLARE